MVELGSRSDLEALQRSGRGKVVVLALLLTSALGAAGWAFFGGKAGIGSPEDPTKVLVVAREEQGAHSAALKDGGFDAAQGTLQHWEARAAEELSPSELGDARGAAAVMRLADRFGYGYVAFEDPEAVDFTGLELSQAIPAREDVGFAVLSAGDLAFPHEVTVNPPPSRVMRDPSLVLLQALFAQEALAALLPGNEAPSVQVIEQRDRLERALYRLAQLPRAELLAEKVERDIETALADERAEPAPVLLGGPLESSTVQPLPSGALLQIRRGFSVTTRDAIRVDIDLEDHESFVFGRPGQRPEAREACDAWMKGSLPTHDSTRYTFAPDGSAVLTKSLSHGRVLWRFAGGAEEPCAFERLGLVPPPEPGTDGVPVPHASGKVARVGSVDGLAVVSVSSAGSQHEQLLGMLPLTRFGDPAWWGDDLLVVPGRSEREDALYFLRPSEPLVVLALPGSVLGGVAGLHQVATIPGESTSLVLTAGAQPRQVFRLDFPVPPSELGALEGSTAPVERDGLPTLRVLDSNRVTATALTHEGRAHDPVVSPDGTRVAFALWAPSLDRPDVAEDDEIALVDLEGGPMTLLTRNALRDHSPRFSADGQHVVFMSRVEVPRSKWVITAPRAVPLSSR